MVCDSEHRPSARAARRKQFLFGQPGTVRDVPTRAAIFDGEARW
jgi:hypothetical protein